MFEEIREILMDLLDVKREEITLRSYLVRDLEMESIDFLELAVALNLRFQVPVNDDTIFLRNMRLELIAARESGLPPLEALKRHYGFLSEERLLAMIDDLETGPVIQVQDLVSYLQWQTKNTKAN